jgi:hypothetical protein
MPPRHFTVTAYMVAFTAFFGPLLSLLLQVWPLAPSSVTWRFGLAGLYSAALMIPTLGALAGYAAAAQAGHVGVLRLVSLVGALIALSVVLVSGMFILDGIQVRSTLADQGTGVFDRSTVGASVHLTLMFAVYSSLAVSAHWSAREGVRHRRQGRESPGIVSSKR